MVMSIIAACGSAIVFSLGIIEARDGNVSAVTYYNYVSWAILSNIWKKKLHFDVDILSSIFNQINVVICESGPFNIREYHLIELMLNF